MDAVPGAADHVGREAPSAGSGSRSRGQEDGDGVLFPALVIGLGGLGRAVLEQLRSDLDGCGPAEITPTSASWHSIAIRTDPAAAVQGPDSLLTEDEVVTPLNKPAHYMKPVRNRAALDTWLNLSMLCRVPRQQTTPQGLRILGRLALVDNYRKVLARLRSELHACVSSAALTTADRQTRLGVRSQPAARLRGCRARRRHRQRHVHRHRLCRPPDLPQPRLPARSGRRTAAAQCRPATKQSPALGNSFAALTELHHFSTPEVTYQAFFDDQEDPLNDPAAPFARSVMVPLPEETAGPPPRTRGRPGRRSAGPRAGDAAGPQHRRPTPGAAPLVRGGVGTGVPGPCAPTATPCRWRRP